MIKIYYSKFKPYVVWLVFDDALGRLPAARIVYGAMPQAMNHRSVLYVSLDECVDLGWEDA